MLVYEYFCVHTLYRDLESQLIIDIMNIDRI